jgi:hypothetical protein
MTLTYGGVVFGIGRVERISLKNGNGISEEMQGCGRTGTTECPQRYELRVTGYRFRVKHETRNQEPGTIMPFLHPPFVASPALVVYIQVIF